MKIPTLAFKPGGAGVVLDLDRLVTSRLLIQANSGGGKSWALRALLEGTHGRIQHLVIDPEGEFASLREHFLYVLAGKEGDVPATPKTAKLLCRRLMELGASAILDLSELDLRERREFVKLFFLELLALPRALWHPTLVILDEAHEFAPEKGHGDSQALDAVIAVGTKGRKRGYCLGLATQRLGKLNKDAAAELNNKLIGRTGLDIDMRRAGDELGFDKVQRQRLRTLEAGTFFAYGPAISQTVQILRTPAVRTRHPEAGAATAAPPPAPKAMQAVLAQLANLPREAAEEAQTVEGLRKDLAEAKFALARASKQKGAPTLAAPSEDVIRARADRLLTTELARIEKALAGPVRNLTDDLTKAHIALSCAIDNCGRIKVPELRLPSQAGKPSGEAIERATRTGWVEVPPNAHVDVATDISRPQLKMLLAIAAFEAIGIDAVRRNNVAVFSGQSPRSSGFDKNCSTLRSAGRIDYVAGDIVMTPEGRSLVDGVPNPLRLNDLDRLHEAWREVVSEPQWRILQALIGAYPGGIPRGELAGVAGQSNTSSGYDKNLSTLRTLGVIEYRSKAVAATALLFPEGLT